MLQPKIRNAALRALQTAAQLWSSEVRRLVDGADPDFRSEAVSDWVLCGACVFLCLCVGVLALVTPRHNRRAIVTLSAHACILMLLLLPGAEGNIWQRTGHSGLRGGCSL